MIDQKQSDINIYVEADGSIVFIYDDEIANVLNDNDKIQIKRASFVEPCNDKSGNWLVDLSPITGKQIVLGPFKERREALFEEVKWLKEFLNNHGLSF